MTVIVDQLGSNELGVVHALAAANGAVDDVHLASGARISVSDAAAAASRLVELGLVEASDTDDGQLFRLLPDQVKAQVAAAAQAASEATAEPAVAAEAEASA